MFLLDTNVVSELRKPKPHGAVLEWIESVPDAALKLSALTIGEIQAGLEKTRRQDATKAAEIEQWLDQVAASMNIIPADAAVVRRWARLMHRQSDTVGDDALIAATALEHGLTVATRNIRHFTHFDVALLNPFEG